MVVRKRLQKIGYNDHRDRESHSRFAWALFRALSNAQTLPVAYATLHFKVLIDTYRTCDVSHMRHITHSICVTSPVTIDSLPITFTTPLFI